MEAEPTKEVLGISLAVLAGIFLGIGAPLAKYGLMDLVRAKGYFNPFSLSDWFFLLESPIFVLGFLCLVAGGLLGFLAYSYAKSIIALPVASGIHYAITPIACFFILGETLNYVELAGILLIIAGVVLFKARRRE